MKRAGALGLSLVPALVKMAKATETKRLLDLICSTVVLPYKMRTQSLAENVIQKLN